MRWLILVLLLVGGTARADGVLVDAVVVVVGNTPIVASQVAFEQELRQRIEGPDCQEQFGRLLCSDRAPRDALVFREILRQQGVARNVEINPAQPAERLAAFQRRFGAREGAQQFLERWRMSEQDLHELFREVATLDQAIDVVVGRLVRDIPEEEQRRYHAENIDVLFEGLPYEDVAPQVSRRYYVVKFERTFAAWASELQSGARIRTIGR